jgi:hypothetical protein
LCRDALLFLKTLFRFSRSLNSNGVLKIRRDSLHTRVQVFMRTNFRLHFGTFENQKDDAKICAHSSKEVGLRSQRYLSVRSESAATDNTKQVYSQPPPPANHSFIDLLIGTTSQANSRGY